MSQEMSQEEKRPQSEADADSESDTSVAEQAELTPENSADLTASAEEVLDEVQVLQKALEQAQNKVGENWNLYLGARAEVENIKRRAERDVQHAHRFALEKFVNELLPVRDSLELGISAANDSADIDKLKEGSELTLKMLAAALEKFGVQEINPLGDKFNPELHEAMAMQPSAEAEPNTILQVIQKGYSLNERLVRPALVIVAKAE